MTIADEPHASDTPAGTDWSRVRARLESASAALQQAWKPPREERLRLLKTRARAFARVPKPAAREDETVEVLVFFLASERYAIETRHVREVCPLRGLTPLPGLPPFVLGLTNHRGQILSVMDLKRFFDLPSTGLTDLNRLLILRSGPMEFGVLADAILEVRTLGRSEIQPVPSGLGELRGDYLVGMTADRTIVLDGAKLIEDERVVVSEKAET